MAGPDMLPTSSDVGLRQPILPERPRILNHVRRDQRAHEGHPLVGLRDAEQILVIPDIDGGLHPFGRRLAAAYLPAKLGLPKRGVHAVRHVSIQPSCPRTA